MLISDLPKLKVFGSWHTITSFSTSEIQNCELLISLAGKEGLKFRGISRQFSHAPTKTNAKKTLDKGLKLFKEANQSALFHKLDDRPENPFCQPQSTTSGSRKRHSSADYSLTRTLAVIEPAKRPVQKFGDIKER